MGAPRNQFAFSLEAAEQAAKRWDSRSSHHAKFFAARKTGKYSGLDSKERLANRANRLLCQLSQQAPELAESMRGDFSDELSEQIHRNSVTAEEVNDLLLERVINETRDFQFIEFLESALYVAKSVARIVTKMSGGRKSFGTGFLVSPSLLLTNHHVLASYEDARSSVAEFNYQRDRLGKPIDVVAFEFDPDRFFVNDKKLDFALVAVKISDRSQLGDFGYCPLIEEQGKIIAMENINIIQHPLGEFKQIVLRENRLIDAFEGKDFVLHYEADTEPGSSGSPVYNDQWEVVAVHHSSIPKKDKNGHWLNRNGKLWNRSDDPAEIDWLANEGIRASKIVEYVRSKKLDGEASDLLAEFLDAGRSSNKKETSSNSNRTSTASLNPTTETRRFSEMQNDTSSNKSKSFSLTIPLHIKITLGEMEDGIVKPIVGSPLSINEEDSTQFEKIVPDPNYDDRPGYDPDFLGFEVPFPKLTAPKQKDAFIVSKSRNAEKYLLDYYHYSVIFNKTRRLAFVAGVNYDPNAKFQHPRDKDGDKWFYDPRVDPEIPRVPPKDKLQAGEDLYKKNPLDRGHLVRRADAAWGSTKKEAKLANDDTFHFTNCSPQHEITNQGIDSRAPDGLLLWGNIEDHIAGQGKQNKLKLCIFNGPIFRANDKMYREIAKLPREYWKVIVYEQQDGSPAAAAFVLSQSQLIEDLEEEFEIGEYKIVQRSLKFLEAKTGLDFGKFTTWDSIQSERTKESLGEPVDAIVISSLDDIVL